MITLRPNCVLPHRRDLDQKIQLGSLHDLDTDSSNTRMSHIAYYFESETFVRIFSIEHLLKFTLLAKRERKRKSLCA